MKDLRHILATATMLALLCASALALDVQKREEPKSPPPKQEKVVPKEEKKDPPRNDGGNRDRGNQQDNRGDKRGRP